MDRYIMAVYSHADDIEGNAGGTLLKYMAQGYKVLYVMSTNNMSGEWNSLNADGSICSRKVPWYEIMPQRKLEAAKAAKLMNDAVVVHLDHPQRHYRDRNGIRHNLGYGTEAVNCAVPETSILTAHEDPAARRQIAELVERYKPEAVLTHDTIQLDLEHIATSLLVTRSLKECGYKGMILLSPCVDEPFCGNIYNCCQSYVDISDYYEGKMELIKVHNCQMPKVDHLTWRPWKLAQGCRHAEAFAVVRAGECSGPLREEILSHWKREEF